MMRYGIMICALVALAAGTAAATTQNVTEWSSDTVAVTDPPTILPIGGSGQVNGNFTVLESFGIQIGLRANRRFSPEPLDVQGATYAIETGESAPGLTLWNYDIHIDMRNSPYSLDDYCISFLSSVPNHSWFDLQSTLSMMDPGTDFGGVTLFQTSQNPGFFDSGVDPNAPGLYTFDLYMMPLTGGPPLSASIVVDVQARPVPEPATMLAVAAGLTGLGGYIRRRMKAKA